MGLSGILTVQTICVPSCYRSRFLDLLIWERHCKDAGLMHLFYSLTFKLDEKQKKTWFVHCYSFRAPPLEPVRSEDRIRESGGNRAWVGAVRTKSESLLIEKMTSEFTCSCRITLKMLGISLGIVWTWQFLYRIEKSWNGTCNADLSTITPESSGSKKSRITEPT